MQPVFVLRHADGAGPGYLAEFLALRGVPLELFRLDEEETMPATLSHASGLAIMGGPRQPGSGTHAPTLERECDLVVEACGRGLPVIGHGSGADIVCLALGGGVAAAQERQIGWFSVQAADGSLAQRWWDGLPADIDVFHWRDTTLSLPAGTEALTCDRQGFVMDKALGLQYHLQITPKMVTEWVARYYESGDRPADGIQAEQEITRALQQRVRALRRLADPVYTRWLQGFGEGPRP